MLTGYFDESGKISDPGNKIVVFAGFITNTFLAECLSHDWRVILQREGLKYFRMVEALHFQGEFKDWNAERRDPVIRELAYELKRRFMASSIVAEPIERFLARPSHLRERWKNDPHYAVFEGCVMQMCNLVAPRGDTLALVCDDEEQLGIECYKLLWKLKRRDTRAKETIASITFANDVYYPPLQAADMLAYAGRTFVLEKDDPKYSIARTVLEICGPDSPELGQAFLEQLKAPVPTSSSVWGVSSSPPRPPRQQ